MKKITLTLGIILGISISGYSQTTTILDSIFEQALIDLSIDSDGIINQSILTSDAAAVTGTLNVKNKSISDLTGIGAFTSITKLDVRENSLTTLDLTSITGLLILEAGDNSLTGVNVTGLTSLERLIIHNNNLTGVNVTSLTGLRYLYAYGNNLSSLDVRLLTGLQRLYIQGNTNLSSIDVTNNTTLDRFRLDESTAIGSKAFLDAMFAASTTISATDSDFRIYKDADGSRCLMFDTDTYSCATTASNEGFKRTKISISPNPASGILNITVAEKADYKLLNIRGQILKKGTLNRGKNKIDISSLSKEIYLLNIKTSKGSFTRKVVRK